MCGVAESAQLLTALALIGCSSHTAVHTPSTSNFLALQHQTHPMFGPFRATSPFSGGLLWYPLPFPPLLSPSFLISLTNLPYLLQENPLPPLRPAKSPPTQTPPRRRHRHRHPRYCAPETRELVEGGREVEGGDAERGGDEAEG